MSPYRESTEEQGSIQRGQDALSCRTRVGEPARQGRRLGSKSKERERGGAAGVRDGVARDRLRPDIRLETRDFLQGFLQIRFENRAASRTSTVSPARLRQSLSGRSKKTRGSFRGRPRVLKFASLLSTILQTQAKGNLRDVATPVSRGCCSGPPGDRRRARRDVRFRGPR